MKCLKIEIVIAISFAYLLTGCGGVMTRYTITGNSKRNKAVAALVDITAERLRLRLDKEGLSAHWHSWARGSLSYDLATFPDAPTTIIFEDYNLSHKRDFTKVKEDLTSGIRRIDPQMQMNSGWVGSAMM